MQWRLEYVNEAFKNADKCNGGILEGCRRADNLFILQCLMERQLNLNHNLIIVFVAFKLTLDIKNRDVLFLRDNGIGFTWKIDQHIE